LFPSEDEEKPSKSVERFMSVSVTGNSSAAPMLSLKPSMCGKLTVQPLIAALLALALPCLGANAGPSVAERIAGIEKRLERFSDDHAKALKALAGADDLGKGIEAFRQHAEKLKGELKDTRGGRDLAAEARELTTELMKQVPGSSTVRLSPLRAGRKRWMEASAPWSNHSTNP
jgi:hypothetical protein